MLFVIVVSVPLSGLTSVNEYSDVVSDSDVFPVSVPLSGLTSVNAYHDEQNRIHDEGFRPLIGVNFCKLTEYMNYVTSDKAVSVPLSGLTSVNGDDEDSKLNNLVSVPLSGLTSVNINLNILPFLSLLSFRPLIGVNFCKQCYIIKTFTFTIIVSVPLSGLTSVNKKI